MNRGIRFHGCSCPPKSGEDFYLDWHLRSRPLQKGPNPKNQIPKSKTCVGLLGFGSWDLVLGVLPFRFTSGPALRKAAQGRWKTKISEWAVAAAVRACA